MRTAPTGRPLPTPLPTVTLAAVALAALALLGNGCGTDDECAARAFTFCTNGVNYWMDSCGVQGDPVETCECGCAADQTTCRACGCEPQCDGRFCGDDGCGGTCEPGCGIGQECTPAGACQMCQPKCEGKQCGPDGCGGECPPGCGAGQICGAAGECEVCTPDCAGRVCGDDGCGGTCAPGCAEGESCLSDGTCAVCDPQCEGRVCGDDGCGGTCAPGCATDERCTDEGRCEGCERDCAGKFCGDDGCGGSCGSCAPGLECAADGQCREPVCGDAPITIEGSFENGVANVAFDAVTVDVEHKMDVDAFEDGCITRIAVHLTRGTGCQLDVVAAGRYEVGGGLVVESVRFAADSFCPGFADEDEGEYTGSPAAGGGLDVATVTPAVIEVPGETVAESCVATTFVVRLEGDLVRAGDGSELSVGTTAITIGGEFLSIGDTEQVCPCRPACEGRECGPDGCGFSCGACEDGARCSDAGACLVRPDGTCWEDGAFRDKDTPVDGDVVITEVMPNPDVVPDGDGEWFEVWLARDIDLNGLGLGRDPAAPPDVVVPEGDCQPVAGGRHVVFAASADAEVNGGLPPVQRTFGFSLANNDGRVFVAYEGVVLDVVTWTSVRAGDARALDPSATDPALNDDDYYWCDAADDLTYGLGDRGTPGEGNGSCGIPLPTCTEGGVARDKVLPEVGDLVITEIMPDPDQVVDGVGEWFEVYVGRDVDLNGLQIGRDALDDRPVVAEGECVRVAAGTRLLFARTGDSGANGGLPAVTALFGLNLVNSDGALRVGLAGTDLDVVTWSSAPRGASLQLDPAARTAAGNDDPANWCDGVTAYGLGDLGTPAAPNAACE